MTPKSCLMISKTPAQSLRVFCRYSVFSGYHGLSDRSTIQRQSQANGNKTRVACPKAPERWTVTFQLKQHDLRQKSKRPNHQDRKTCQSWTHPQPKCQSRALTPVTHHQPCRITGSPASRSAPPALAPTGSARYYTGLSTLHPCHPARICRT